MDAFIVVWIISCLHCHSVPSVTVLEIPFSSTDLASFHNSMFYVLCLAFGHYKDHVFCFDFVITAIVLIDLRSFKEDSKTKIWPEIRSFFY